ncbi:MAG: D-sedoheptulose 7-phosphate isomerase [Candidatus Omnitrophota bacterium]
MTDLREKIKDIINESIEAKKEFLETQVETISSMAGAIIEAVKNGKKLIVFGNGGSAADSQHIVAELIGRFKKERPPIPAIALTTNTSTLTAIGNDYGYSMSFKRQLEGLGNRGDIALGISTSGNAENVYEALMSAKKLGLKIITMTGRSGGKISKLAEVALKAPSDNTPRIQELHITVGHIICELVEDGLCK